MLTVFPDQADDFFFTATEAEVVNLLKADFNAKRNDPSHTCQSGEAIAAGFSGQTTYGDYNGEDTKEKYEEVYEDVRTELEAIAKPARVILIGGANLSVNGTDISEETKLIYNGIDRNKLFDIKALNLFQLIPDGVIFPEIIDEIKSEYKQGQKIILYGYSMGGVGVLRMSRSLEELNIPITLLITVDAAYTYLFSGLIDRTVPDNVLRNVNYFQTNKLDAPPLNSYGEPNTGKNVINIDQSNVVFKGNKMNHSEIDEYNIQNVINLINDEIR